MDNVSSNLRLWPADADQRGDTSRPVDLAQRLYANEIMQPAAAPPADGPEPFSLQWFLTIENLRHGRHGHWIAKLLEFAKHPGETLLGLGHGLGTDWLQYARNGANVIVSSPSTAQLTLMRRNFELRGLPGRFVPALPSRLPLDPSSVDVVCISGLLQAVADPVAVITEVYRVLKPGGKVLALAPAKYDVNRWARTCFFLQRWLDAGYRRPHEIEGMRFSARHLHQLFGRFVEHRVHKRHLRRVEAPHLWRWLPRPLLERLMGHCLIIKAFKPLSSAIPATAAA